MLTFSYLKTKYPDVSADQRMTKQASAIKNFSISNPYDIFLSHSYADKDDIARIAEFFEEYGFSVFIDWKEATELKRDNINSNTAQILKEKMKESKSLVFVTTEHYPNSKWMPWELGYMDGLKERVAILPVLEKADSAYKGQEYLGLYPYINARKYAGKNEAALWAWEDSSTYCLLTNWIKGEKFKKL